MAGANHYTNCQGLIMTDKQWLQSRMPEVTENEMDWFLNRVSIMIHDAHMDEFDARNIALTHLIGRQNEN